MTGVIRAVAAAALAVPLLGGQVRGGSIPITLSSPVTSPGGGTFDTLDGLLLNLFASGRFEAQVDGATITRTLDVAGYTYTPSPVGTGTGTGTTTGTGTSGSSGSGDSPVALTVDALAHLAGLDHFNFVNLIVAQPADWKVVDWLTSSPLPLPRFDPQVDPIVIETPRGNGFVDGLGDGSGFYYNESPAQWKIYDKGSTFSFTDAPRYPGLFAPTGLDQSVTFQTSLVGVYANGDIATWSNIGTTMTWSTDAVSASGPLAYEQTIDDGTLPPVVSGGVFGVGFDGPAAAVPEPASLVMGATASLAGVSVAWLRVRRRRSGRPPVSD